MGELVKALAAHPAAFVACSIAAATALLAIAAIFVVAFKQGRSVSFWPPNIGAKPQPSESSTIAKGRMLEPQDTPVAVNDGPVGQTLTISGGGKIAVGNLLHQGDKATVLRGKDDAGQNVAIKIFRHGVLSNTAQAGFVREFKAGQGLSHRNIVRTIDHGFWNECPFLVTELLAGGSLADLIASRDRIRGEEILSIAEQVATGLDYAHSQGTIHRDITPANILMDSDARGRVAISDFGIARVFGAFQVSATQAKGMFEGTPIYVAPEIFTSGAVTPAADIYGFGAVLYELITGKPPFRDIDSMFSLYQKKVQEPVPQLLTLRQVPEALNARILQAMDVDPARRPATARAVLSGLEDAISSL